MSNKFVFELIEEIDCTVLPGIIYRCKEDAWKRIGFTVDKFIGDHTYINITTFEIDQKRSIVYIEYNDKRTGAVHYRHYRIWARFVR